MHTFTPHAGRLWRKTTVALLAALLSLVLAAGCASAATGAGSSGSSITVVDTEGRTVTVPQPLTKVVVTEPSIAEVMRSLGLGDRIVGVHESMHDNPFWPGRLGDLPQVATWSTVNYEKIAELQPQVVLSSTDSHGVVSNDEHLAAFDMVDVKLSFRRPAVMADEIALLGQIFDVPDRARQLNDWIGQQLGGIEAKLADIPEGERPTVFVENHGGDYKTGGPGTRFYEQVVDAGGRNLAAGMQGEGQVSDEWVAEQNPDVIIREASAGLAYETRGTGEAQALLDGIVSRPGLAGTSAVENGRVYLVSLGIYSRPGFVASVAYIARWLHPNLFADLDPDAVLCEYLTEFQGLPCQGVWVYPDDGAARP